jgi:pimeloyl-ACP methyl ester carboxylesterase
MKQIIDERMSENDRLKLKHIEESIDDYEERMIEKYKIIGKLQEYEHFEHEKREDDGSFDKQGHLETWNDLVRLRDNGTYPAAFASIQSPVIMLHGVYDPHPGRMIYDSLKPYIPKLEYKEWQKCGHYPWREKYARDDFFSVLTNWIKSQ